eukprot:jgi/Bigna1/136947/aug1.36_g11655
MSPALGLWLCSVVLLPKIHATNARSTPLISLMMGHVLLDVRRLRGGGRLKSYSGGNKSSGSKSRQKRKQKSESIPVASKRISCRIAAPQKPAASNRKKTNASSSVMSKQGKDDMTTLTSCKRPQFALKFEFTLKSGQYATMLMREIMKNDLKGGPIG